MTDDTVYAVISVDDASIEEGEQAVFSSIEEGSRRSSRFAARQRRQCGDGDVGYRRDAGMDGRCGECGRCGTVADDGNGDQWQYDGDGDCGR